MTLRSDRAAFVLGVAVFVLWVLFVPAHLLHLPTIQPTWNPWSALMLAVAFVLIVAAAVPLSSRRARSRLSANKWAVVAVVGLVVLLVAVPVLVLAWPSPSYYSQGGFIGLGLAAGVRFVSDGPMAAGNPIYADVVSLQDLCPPWNVTSITMWIYGLNRSTEGQIVVGPTPVDFRTCDVPPPSSLVLSSWTNGSIVFYSSGYMPIVAYLNVTHTGGFTDLWTGLSWGLPISPGDSLWSYYNLKLVGVSIIMAAALTGWLPTVHSLEQYVSRIRKG